MTISDADALWAELAGPAVARRRPDFRFDEAFYRATYADLRGYDGPLAEHFARHGRAEGRIATLYRRDATRHPDLGQRLRPLVTEPRLARLLADEAPDAAELAFELMQLGHDTDARVSDFSAAHYLRSHQDVARAGINPLLHYLYYGAREERRTLRDIRRDHLAGDRPFDPSRRSCLVVTHEMSRTGAPIVALGLAREAAESCNVMVLALRGGPLLPDFRSTACEVAITGRPEIDLAYLRSEALDRAETAVINSVEADATLAYLAIRGIPCAIYIHEYPDYIFPSYKATVAGLYADLLVFSSESVRQSWAPILADLDADIGRDSLVLPQRLPVVGAINDAAIAQARGRLSRAIGRDCRGARIVCGAGTVQLRKGTDLFAIAAQIVRPRDPDTLFVWVGDGLNLEDPQFGVWMGVHLRQSRAGDPDSNLVMLPAGPLYRDVLVASDAMFLSSRLDPLPNVAFDALAAGCRVILFAGATGFADAPYLATGQVEAVAHGDVAAAAAAILRLPRKTALPAARQPARQSARQSTGQPAPPPPLRLHHRLQAELAARVAARRRLVLESPVAPVSRPKPPLAGGDRLAARRLREKCLALGRRYLWRDAAEAAEALEDSGNWVHRRCRLGLSAVAAPGALPPFGLHVHAYYLDGLDETLACGGLAARARRLVVTTDGGDKARRARDILRGAGLDRGEVVVVENRGRDVLPFLGLFAEGGRGLGEGLWCHIHEKRSASTLAEAEARAWLRLLHATLLGEGGAPSNAVCILAEEGVGLVTAFDPHALSWTASRRLLPRVAGAFPGPLPESPLLFPVGNMFWVRREVVVAMAAVFGPDYPWPNEPIANDGTEYHLIERLWPSVAASLDLDAVFLERPGLTRSV